MHHEAQFPRQTAFSATLIHKITCLFLGECMKDTAPRGGRRAVFFVRHLQWRLPDLNRGHRHFQCRALPTELPRLSQLGYISLSIRYKLFQCRTTVMAPRKPGLMSSRVANSLRSCRPCSGSISSERMPGAFPASSTTSPRGEMRSEPPP